MPIDMALPLFLSKEDFIYRTQTCEPAPSSCLRFQRSLCVDQPEDSLSSRTNTRKAKKQVTFADHRGLALTRVKVFSQFSDPIQIPLKIQETLRSTPAPEDQLVLDFAQPSSDYLSFRQSLETNLVCLEHCVLKDKELAGTVKVKNVSFQKSVRLRVTFDSWASHSDVFCQFVKDSYPSMHCDTFSFSVALPDQLKPHERVEFAVCYEVDGREHWDSNHGDNYRVVWSSMKTSRQVAPSNHGFDYGIHFDRYGSPTCSHGIFPDWPSYSVYENTGPYY